MDAPPADDRDVEFAVTPVAVEAAARDGVALLVGRSVRPALIVDAPPCRVLPFIGMADSGKCDLGTRAKDIARIGMGRRTG